MAERLPSPKQAKSRAMRGVGSDRSEVDGWAGVVGRDGEVGEPGAELGGLVGEVVDCCALLVPDPEPTGPVGVDRLPSAASSISRATSNGRSTG